MLRNDPKASHKMLLEQPSFFMEMVCQVFRAKDEKTAEASALQKSRATNAYRLLKSLKSPLGQSDQDVDQDALLAWCLEIQRLATERNRQDITDQLIGQVLAHAPLSSKDRAWPHEAVRHVIETLASPQVELGIRIERFNMRGVFCKAMGEGGDQERSLPSQHEWADASLDSVRTNALLELIAQAFGEDAERADTMARQDALRH